MKKFIPVLIIIILGLTFSCDLKPRAEGNLDELIVFADSLDWIDYKDALKFHFCKEYFTPVIEYEFILTWQPIKALKNYQKQRNLIFLGRLDSRMAASQQVISILDDEVKTSVKSGKAFYIPQKDFWAKDQYVLILVAPTKDVMIQNIYNLGELAYQGFKKTYYKRVQKSLYRNGRNKKVEEYLLRHFPFTMNVPPDFQVVDESVSKGYVWLRRFNPDRSIFVHWIPYQDSIKIDNDWIIARRNKLTEKLYDGDVVVEEETTIKPVKFGQWPAHRLEGTWKNLKHLIGGPFRSVTFIDHKSNLIFMVDFYVQAIARRKKPYLDQLEVMAKTFQSKINIKRN